jgi:hypothetical protein
MRSPSFLSLLGLIVIVGSLGCIQGCFFGDDDAVHRSPPSSSGSGSGSGNGTASAPGSACTESRPQILALDMQPSATVGSQGDYEISGTIRYSCSGVTVQAHVYDPDGYVRWAPSPAGGAPATLSLRFAASQKGQTVQYEVSVFDALGNQSWPPLRQSVTLE